MPTCATGERDGAEEDHPEQEPIDGRYPDLQEEIWLGDENMVATQPEWMCSWHNFRQHPE